MRNLRFESICLLSPRDRKARKIAFHPRKNLLLGRNHTGKSSLIRAVFESLGATPQGTLEHWDEKTITLVEFTVDQTTYFALHQQGHRAMFDSGLTLLLATGRHSEWTRQFNTVIGFNLVFTDKEANVAEADASCFFLPFYINQDGSWQSEWNTFRNMRRFSSPWTAILEYFTGIAPPEYYALRAERDKENKALDELSRELTLLERARARLDRSMSLTGPKVDAANFEREVKRLTEEVTELNARQEVIRDSSVKQQELLSGIRLQIRLAEEALANYRGDTKYLRQTADQTLVCPTCGAEHAKSFLDLISYAEEARVVEDMILRLRDDLGKVEKEYQATRDTLQQLRSNYDRVAEILETRRGEMQFAQVVKSMGAESAFRAFEEEHGVLKKQVDDRVLVLHDIDTKIKALRNSKRTKEITSGFRSYYAAARNALNLPTTDVSRMKVNSRPQLSGSGGPRSILAYYSAIWRSCQGPESAFDVPVFIDSPNQQSQDDVNLPAVIQFIAQGLPAGMQIVVGLESAPADYSFDQVIHLDEPYSVLRAAEFEQVQSEVDPLLAAMYGNLLRTESIATDPNSQSV